MTDTDGQATRHASRREEILEGALRLFSEEGYEKVGLKRIAGSLGLTHPALYHYFSSKEELVAAAVTRAMDQLLGAIATVVAETPAHPPLRLHAMARAQVLHELDARAVVPFVNAVLYGPLRSSTHLAPEQRATIRARQRAHLAGYRDVIVRGQASGDFVPGPPTIHTFGILGLLSYAVFWFREDGTLDRAAVADRLATQAVRSVSRLVAV